MIVAGAVPPQLGDATQPSVGRAILIFGGVFAALGGLAFVAARQPSKVKWKRHRWTRD